LQRAREEIKMKRVLAIGITAAVVVAIALLSGCGSTTTATPQGTTTAVPPKTTAPENTTTTAPREITTSAQSYTEYAHVSTWWADWGGSTTYVHFKAVLEPSGTTITEAIGSDSVLAKDVQQLPETTARAALVEQLESKMADLGWTKLGKSGPDWYEIRWGK
jgi:hypothetical protein